MCIPHSSACILRAEPQYVETEDGHRYILRIYNNGGKSEKVVYEVRRPAVHHVRHTVPALNAVITAETCRLGDQCGTQGPGCGMGGSKRLRVRPTGARGQRGSY